MTFPAEMDSRNDGNHPLAGGKAIYLPPVQAGIANCKAVTGWRTIKRSSIYAASRQTNKTRVFWSVGLEFNVPFHHKCGYIRDDDFWSYLRQM